MSEYTVDLDRPFITEETRQKWINFHQYCRDLSKKGNSIRPNRMFSLIESFAKEGKGYSGGGYHYMFWFDNEKDRQEFLSYINENNISLWKN